MDKEDQEQNLALYKRRVVNIFLYVFIILRTFKRKIKSLGFKSLKVAGEVQLRVISVELSLR